MKELVTALLYAAPLVLVELRRGIPELFGFERFAPDPVVLAVVFAAVRVKPEPACFFAAVLGLLCDLPAGTPFGLGGARLALLVMALTTFAAVTGLWEKTVVTVEKIVDSDLLADPGASRTATIETEADWRLELSALSSPLRARLTLTSVSGGIQARGRVTVGVTHTCHRCLSEWDEDLEVEIMEMVGLADDPDGYRLDGEVADLEEPIRDAVLLALPLVPTCRPGCRGLCAVCGGDLNTGACSGHEEQHDSPFASLRELLEP